MVSFGRDPAGRAFRSARHFAAIPHAVTITFFPKRMFCSLLAFFCLETKEAKIQAYNLLNTFSH